MSRFSCVAIPARARPQGCAPAGMYAYRDVGGRPCLEQAVDAYRDVGGRPRLEQAVDAYRAVRLQGCTPTGMQVVDRVWNQRSRWQSRVWNQRPDASGAGVVNGCRCRPLAGCINYGLSFSPACGGRVGMSNKNNWIPAFAGMTAKVAPVAVSCRPVCRARSE